MDMPKPFFGEKLSCARFSKRRTLNEAIGPRFFRQKRGQTVEKISKEGGGFDFVFGDNSLDNI
ncbi:MAG TPA: hypothetical protein VHA52_05795 [Candidatus Babeliaceae bacterium]|nr:hypothetical protein [Candidatus Babeliaceae bacterium]